MFHSQKGPEGFCVAYTRGIAARLNPLSFRGMMSLPSAPPRLHSTEEFSPVTDRVEIVTDTCSCVNTPDYV